MTKQAAYHARKPWVRHVCWARRRCLSNDRRWAAHYLDKGITCDLTAAEAEMLWHRDGGASMSRPSLDRKDPSAGYTFDNCRFAEFLVNVGAPHSAEMQEHLDNETVPAWVTEN